MNIDQTHYVSGVRLWLNHLFAMFLKRILSTWRAWLLLLVQILVPVIFIVLSFVSKKNMPFGQDLRAMEISLGKYNKPVTLISGESPYLEAYKSIAKKRGGKIIETDDISEKALSIVSIIYILKKKWQFNC